MTEPCWRLQTFEGPDDLREFAVQAHRNLRISEFQHDPEWLDAENHGTTDQTVVLAARFDAGIHGLLAARVSSRPFEYTAGGLAVLRKTVRQFSIHQGIVTSNLASSDAVEQCLCELARNMAGNAVAYLSAVPIGSCVHKTLTDANSKTRKYFHVLPWGGQSPHFKIRWEGSVEAYFASVGAKKRGNIKRALQRFKSTAPYRVQRFQTPSDVDGFLRDAISISAKSYQSQKLELGLRADSGREALIRFVAARGAFVGYILYAKETPIAYRYGYIYGTTLFAISTAYDPEWSDLKPGAVIFLEMLLDLEKTKVPINLIDLLPHDNSFKRDRANVVIATQNYFLFKRSIPGAALYFPIRGLEACKPVAKWIANWLHRRAP